MKKSVNFVKIMFGIMALSFSLCGCKGAKDEAKEISSKESVVEETVVTETQTLEQDEIKESTDNENVIETHEQVPMIDWEIFATQEDSDDICLVISNESIGKQQVLYEGVFYPYQEGDKIAIPIRENILRIGYFTLKEDGKTKEKEALQLYWKDEGTSNKYIEFEVGDEVGYMILVTDIEGNHATFTISTVAEVEEAIYY